MLRAIYFSKNLKILTGKFYIFVLSCYTAVDIHNIYKLLKHTFKKKSEPFLIPVLKFKKDLKPEFFFICNN